MRNKHMELKVKYYDKNWKRIKVGMLLRHDDGEVEEVYKTIDGDLGFNATNKEWCGWDGVPRELYPLHSFDLDEWTIVSERELKRASTQSKR